MIVVSDPRIFRDHCDSARAQGRPVGFVPTMGALHEGHMALVDSLPKNAFRAMSIFVNPLQFGAGEDLDRYPRTLEADLEHCKAHGVDAVFTPTPAMMYPPGFCTTVTVSGMTERFEGVFRPTHFAGVTTVVSKLLHAAGPCTAVFGRKDYQQWRVLERMASDLLLPVQIIGHDIVRESDGLALSSRNRYLSPGERERALCLSRALRLCEQEWKRGLRSAADFERLATAEIAPHVDKIDYIAAADPKSLGEPQVGEGLVLLLAVHIGKTRLIDNLELS